MKKNYAPIIGAVLFWAGCLLMVLALGGLLLAGSNGPVTNAQRLRLAESAERSITTAHKLMQDRIGDLRAYYEKRMAEVSENAEYEARLEQLSELEAAMLEGQPVSEEMLHFWRRQQSVDGVGEEVLSLNHLRNQLSTLYENEAASARYREEIAAHPEEDETQEPSGPAYLRLVPVLCLAALMIGTGLWLNHGYRLKRAARQAVLYLALILGAVIMVFPFYWMFASSFKSRIEVGAFPPRFFPANPANLDNYRVAFKQAPFAIYFVNSVIVCVLNVAIVTVTTILAAFAFSRLNFPGRELIFSILLSMMMLPFEMLVITNYSTIVHLKLNDTLTALIIPFISSIFYTYIMRNFFASISDSLYWSSRVDGCSNWKYLWKVMVPIGRPSLVTVILLNALASWNSFMWPLLVIKTTPKRTLPFGLYAFTTEAGDAQELVMAASTVVVLPMIVLFLFARKQILRGVARGGIKG